MTNNKNKKRNIKVGQIYLTDTHAAVRVKIKVTRKEINPWTKEDMWFGVLIDEKDAIALHEAGVPYSKINVDESFIFEYQIVKRINQSRKASKNANTNRKRKARRTKQKPIRKGS